MLQVFSLEARVPSPLYYVAGATAGVKSTKAFPHLPSMPSTLHFISFKVPRAAMIHAAASSPLALRSAKSPRLYSNDRIFFPLPPAFVQKPPSVADLAAAMDERSEDKSSCSKSKLSCILRRYVSFASISGIRRETCRIRAPIMISKASNAVSCRKALGTNGVRSKNGR